MDNEEKITVLCNRETDVNEKYQCIGELLIPDKDEVNNGCLSHGNQIPLCSCLLLSQ